MSFSRRAFVKTLGVGGAAALSGAYIPRAGGFFVEPAFAQDRPLLLHNNENPLGPGDRCLGAIRDLLGSDGRAVGRYPFSLTPRLAQAVGNAYGVGADHIILGTGSTQVLRTATEVYCSPTRPLVTATPTYEECTQYAELTGKAITEVALNDQLQLDLDAMADAARGAGMVFLNNPNNPTATVHSYDAISGFIDNVLTASPDTTILVDEAYHDYVTDPAHESQYATPANNPRVLVARTFSKAHGMAGLRIGFVIAHPDTVAELRPWHSGNTLNTPGVVAAEVSINDPARIEAERERNTAARQYTLDWFSEAGFEATDSQTNFIFVKTGMAAQEFRDGCRENGVLVGRNFPPYQNEYARISIGTLEQMQQATEVFGRVMGVRTSAAA